MYNLWTMVPELNTWYLLLVCNHGGSESSLSGLSINIDIIVRPDLLIAILFDVGFAWPTSPATPHNHTHAYSLSHFEFLHVWTNLCHFSYNFMPVCQVSNNRKKINNRRSIKVKEVRSNRQRGWWYVTRGPWGSLTCLGGFSLGGYLCGKCHSTAP